MKKLTIICALVLVYLSTPAQEVAPLQLGNVWVYDYGPSTNTLGKITVIDTNIVIDTVSYIKLAGISNYDTTKRDIYSRLKPDGYYAIRRNNDYPAPDHELIYYKKDAAKGDTWTQPDPWSSGNREVTYTVQDTFVTTVFGKTTTVKYLTVDSGLTLLDEYWTEEFGKLSSSDFGDLQYSLRGCVIDGKVYGDTSFVIVGVEEDADLPSGFNLSQNYPNPFNPTTKIEYSIPQQSKVKIEIYNLLGEKQSILVNSIQQRGTHTVEWNAASFSSGVYFYKITAGSFVETKKVLLIK